MNNIFWIYKNEVAGRLGQMMPSARISVILDTFRKLLICIQKRTPPYFFISFELRVIGAL